MSMRHATRMLLIPEEVYNELMNATSKTRPPTSIPQGTTIEEDVNPEDVPIARSRARMSHIVTSATGSAERKNMHYNQEFKRLNDMTRARQNRPLLVDFPASSSSAASQQQQQQQRRSNESVKKTPGALFPDVDSSAKIGPPPPVDQKELDEIMEYVRTHADQLLLTPDLQVMAGGIGLPVRNSDARTIIEYQLRNVKGTKAPPGYRSLIAQAKKDTFLRDRLHLVDVQAGRGLVRFKTTPTRGIHKKTKRASTAFKPQLW
jgi:hypothetical protein